MSTQFTNIRITDLHVDRTQPSQKASGLRLMYLKLSASPPPEWIQLFEQERSFPRHSMWREARIEGSYIVVDCVPEELERYHLRDLNEDVENSNRKYVQWLGRANAQQQLNVDVQQRERERLDALRSRLKFD